MLHSFLRWEILARAFEHKKTPPIKAEFLKRKITTNYFFG
jgi:hypothetical protein